MTQFNYFSPYHDLISPDGKIVNLVKCSEDTLQICVLFEKIPSNFVGFQIEKELICFNLKSTLAQLGTEAVLKGLEIDNKNHSALAYLDLVAKNNLSKCLLPLLLPGAFVGKLFAQDPRRKVRNPDYLSRLFGRLDRFGKPLLSLGNHHESKDFILEKVGDRTVAFLTLKNGKCLYQDSIYGFLPTIAKSLPFRHFNVREFLRLHQHMKFDEPRSVAPNEMLLVQTQPLYIRTAFAKVADDLLPKGFYHTQANILQPDTLASGNIYEFYGDSQEQIQDVPLEFYTLEPYREHVFFQDRDQLISALDDPQIVFKAFETAPKPKDSKCATFIVKSQQLLNLKETDWIQEEAPMEKFPGIFQAERQAKMIETYIQKQASYPYLHAMMEENITSQGVLFCRYFPSPLLKPLLINKTIQHYLKGIYFQYPSKRNGEFFSQEDRFMLLDLAKFGIPVYWVDPRLKTILQYVPREEKDCGMFVPPKHGEKFYRATAIGVYGSHLIPGGFEQEIYDLLEGLLALKEKTNHPLLNPKKDLILVTGGGPGAMDMANKVAKELGILSCANIVDFKKSIGGSALTEQEQNPYVEAKMTYKAERLVERQAEFHLNLPIFVIGGIGTDFEFSLEEVQRKTGVVQPTPVLLFGDPEYWREKVTSRYRLNLKTGVIKGSEWVSNCFYCVQTAKAGLQIYEEFFKGTLAIGKDYPSYPEGFKIVT